MDILKEEISKVWRSSNTIRYRWIIVGWLVKKGNLKSSLKENGRLKTSEMK